MSVPILARMSQVEISSQCSLATAPAQCRSGTNIAAEVAAQPTNPVLDRLAAADHPSLPDSAAAKVSVPMAVHSETVACAPCTAAAKRGNVQRVAQKRSQNQRQKGPGAGAVECRRRMERLQKLLSKLQPAKRQQAISQLLSQPQRLALEQWIIAERAARSPKMAAAAAAAAVGRAALAGAKACGRRVRQSGAAVEQEALGLRKKRPMTAQQSKRPKISGSIDALGVMKNVQPQGCFYSASFWVGAGVYLLSKAERDLGRVLAYRDVLQRVRNRMLSEDAFSTKGGKTLEKQALDFEEQLGTALSEVLGETSLTPASMGLRLRVDIHLPWARRHLRTKPYRVASDIDAALLHWRRLILCPGLAICSGKQQAKTPAELRVGWALLREAYGDVALATGCSKAVVEARLRPFDLAVQRRFTPSRSHAACARVSRLWADCEPLAAAADDGGCNPPGEADQQLQLPRSSVKQTLYEQRLVRLLSQWEKQVDLRLRQKRRTDSPVHSRSPRKRSKVIN
eukprot:TRINITY_DN13214_c0_g2_i1.p1 TRINITY_DN13214_c0_g2~~TRINITY_DN13214_c0_g2_i1.p1  ORF type:complete len:512 (-),score=112.68 TRINITY_DN13214_c0_g2_i1:217-1752(-)